MFIQTELTPNPNSLKFLPGQTIVESSDTFEFKSKEHAAKSELAQNLFAIEGVEEVFFGSDFITISKNDKTHWEILKPEVLVCIMDFLVSEKPVMDDAAGEGLSEDNNEISEDDDKLTAQIKEILNTRIRPAVAMDGGDIIFAEFTDGIVKLKLKGACSGCPSSTVTLKNGIENMLKHYVPEVIEVVSI